MTNNSILTNLSVKNKRTISRTISLIENNNSEELQNEIFRNTGKAYRIGITGPPGAGKSTITNQLTKILRKENYSVGIIAVDPTSPFTGGALLGDRVRMNEIGMDEFVFIRSMASRGSLGGLSKKTIDAADVLDAAGFDFIILETVGVGQSELDIVKVADSTIVCLVPESGDSVQAMKAGLMEIADIFVLNKADRPGAESAFSSIKSMLQLKQRDDKDWIPEVIQTVASENKGISEIFASIKNHKNFLTSNNQLNENRLKNMRIRVEELIMLQLRATLNSDAIIVYLKNNLPLLIAGGKTPFELARELNENFNLVNRRE